METVLLLLRLVLAAVPATAGVTAEAPRRV
jgi:hypothetical protein